MWLRRLEGIRGWREFEVQEDSRFEGIRGSRELEVRLTSLTPMARGDLRFA